MRTQTNRSILQGKSAGFACRVYSAHAYHERWATRMTIRLQTLGAEGPCRWVGPPPGRSRHACRAAMLGARVTGHNCATTCSAPIACRGPRLARNLPSGGQKTVGSRALEPMKSLFLRPMASLLVPQQGTEARTHGRVRVLLDARRASYVVLRCRVFPVSLILEVVRDLSLAKSRGIIGRSLPPCAAAVTRWRTRR